MGLGLEGKSVGWCMHKVGGVRGLRKQRVNSIMTKISALRTIRDDSRESDNMNGSLVACKDLLFPLQRTGIFPNIYNPS